MFDEYKSSIENDMLIYKCSVCGRVFFYGLLDTALINIKCDACKATNVILVENNLENSRIKHLRKPNDGKCEPLDGHNKAIIISKSENDKKES